MDSGPTVYRGNTHVLWLLLIGAEDFEGGETLDSVLPSDAFVIIAIDGTEPYSALNPSAEQGWASVISELQVQIRLCDCTDVGFESDLTCGGGLDVVRLQSDNP